MIYLALCRIGFCEICTASFLLPDGGEVFKECPACGTEMWQWGVEPLDSVRIRMGIKKNSKVVNPGVKSKKRQERGIAWGKAQWRQFKPKPVDAPPTGKDN